MDPTDKKERENTKTNLMADKCQNNNTATVGKRYLQYVALVAR